MAQAQCGDSGALEELAQRYWYPLYAFLRRAGRSREDAQDLVQGFFADLLARERLGQPDAARGKFRTFLLTRLESYARDQWRREQALKRGKGVVLISRDGAQDEVNYQDEPKELRDPARIYDRAWAEQVHQQACALLRAKWVRAGDGEYFALLEPLLWGEKAEGGYAPIAERRGISEGAVRKAVHDLRKALRRALRELLRAEVPGEPSEVQDAENLRDFYRAMGA